MRSVGAKGLAAASIWLAAAGVALIALGAYGIAVSRPEPLSGYPGPTASSTPSAPPSQPVPRPVGQGFPEPSYPGMPAGGDKLGTLSIPSLDTTLPVIEGTSEAELDRGVGHYAGSVLPGQDDNCVLSGHRGTVFEGLGELGKGDLIVVRTAAGTYTYAVSGTRVVDKDDRTVIVPRDHAVLTVTTCYPFHFVGNAPDRYVVAADMVSAIPAR